MTTPTKTRRLRAEPRSEIDRIAKRSRRSFSEVTQDLLEEALRMRECPGIYFADEPAGREAKVGGTGLGIWEVIRDYLAASKDLRLVKKALPPPLRRTDQGLLPLLLLVNPLSRSTPDRRSLTPREPPTKLGGPA